MTQREKVSDDVKGIERVLRELQEKIEKCPHEIEYSKTPHRSDIGTRGLVMGGYCKKCGIYYSERSLTDEEWTNYRKWLDEMRTQPVTI
jgi:hypothetical protein